MLAVRPRFLPAMPCLHRSQLSLSLPLKCAAVARPARAPLVSRSSLIARVLLVARVSLALSSLAPSSLAPFSLPPILAAAVLAARRSRCVLGSKSRQCRRQVCRRQGAPPSVAVSDGSNRVSLLR